MSEKEVIQDDVVSDLSTRPGHENFMGWLRSAYTLLVGSNEEALISAVYDGSGIRIMNLIDKGVDTNILDNDGNGLIHVAVRARQSDIIPFLVNLGLDINCVNVNGISPLMFAIELGFDDIVVEILQVKELDINQIDLKGRTALHYAAIHGNAVVTDMLLENKINVDQEDVNKNNALHLCCEKGSFNVAKVLMRWHIDLEHKNKYGFIPLGTAVSFRRRDMIRLITAAMRGTDHKHFESIVDSMLDLTCDLDHYVKVLEDTPIHFKGGLNDFEEIRQE
ncbi:ankyrin repeat-containing protein [Entamoeba marina]